LTPFLHFRHLLAAKTLPVLFEKGPELPHCVDPPTRNDSHFSPAATAIDILLTKRLFFRRFAIASCERAIQEVTCGGKAVSFALEGDFYLMRRYLPHIVVVVASLVSLAMIWSNEPPITYLPKIKRSVSATQGIAKRDYYLRLVTQQNLDLTELKVKIAWDPQVLKSPNAWQATMSRKMRPRKTIKDDEMTITFRPGPERARRMAKNGKTPILQGKGRLARIGFNLVGENVKPTAASVWVVDAAGVRLTGEDVAPTGLALEPFKPSTAAHAKGTRRLVKKTSVHKEK
jgi:hypothetical protein